MGNEQVSDRAIEWFARMRADDVDEAERRDFFQWLRQERDHQLAFVEIVRLWDGLAVVKNMDFPELREFPILWKLKQDIDSKASV